MPIYGKRSYKDLWPKIYFQSYSVLMYKGCIVYHILTAQCQLDLSSSSTGFKVRKQVKNSSHDHISKTNAHIVNFEVRTIFSIIGYSKTIIYIPNPSRSRLYQFRFARKKSIIEDAHIVSISRSDLLLDPQKIVSNVYDTVAFGYPFELSSRISQFLFTK